MDEIETTYVPTAMVLDNPNFNGKKVSVSYIYLLNISIIYNITIL